MSEMKNAFFKAYFINCFALNYFDFPKFIETVYILLHHNTI